MSEYPEHEKMQAVQGESQAIGEFIEFGLAAQSFVICEASRSGRFYPANRSIQDMLARYFEIDLDKIEAEKRAMLDAMRAATPPAKAPAEIAQEARVAEAQTGNENALEHLREAQKHGIA